MGFAITTVKVRKGGCVPKASKQQKSASKNTPKAGGPEQLLELIKTETAKGEGAFAMVEHNDHLQTLIDTNQVLINPAITDGKLIAARYEPESGANTITALPNGAAHDGGAADGENMELMEEDRLETKPEVLDMDGKEVLRGMLPPEPKRGGAKKEDWPYSKMEVGDSFLVPVTDKYPEPWTSFQSNVASNVRRFAEVVPGQTTKNGNPKKQATRKFALRRVTKGDTYPNGYVEPSDGARVFRTA